MILAFAGGCGFQPLYATDTAVGDDAAAVPAAREELAATLVAPIADRPGQILRNELVFLLSKGGESAAPRYALNVALTESLSTLAVRATGLATRASLRLYARYELVDLATGQIMTQGQVGALGSYDLLENEFATLIAARYTREQAAKRLARILHVRLAAFYGSRKVAGGGAGAEPAVATSPDATGAYTTGARD